MAPKRVEPLRGYVPVGRPVPEVVDRDPVVASFVEQMKAEREAIERGEMPPVVVKPSAQ